MSSKPKSRWADTDADAELNAKLEREKQEKRQRKAEKARKLEAQRQAAQAVPPPRDGSENDDDDDADHGRPSKRRRITPNPPSAGAAANSDAPPKLLRFETGSWGKCPNVDKYQKLNDIEEGTYGWVARATEVSTGRIVALKRLKLMPSDRDGLPVTGLREIQILRSCNHGNVVALHEVVVGSEVFKRDKQVHDPSIFLVMEFLEHDLGSILADMPQPFLSSEIKQLLLQLSSGVSYLHENRILHRDLKTANLLLNNRGRLKIADFGMARYVGYPPPDLTQLVVTLWYRAPELLLGAKAYDAAVDMWSVGCIFGELLLGEPLLKGANEVDQVLKVVQLCGVPTEDTWPGFKKLPNSRCLRFPPKSAVPTGSVVRTKFPNLTAAGASLLNDLLSLNPLYRPSADEVLKHEYFAQDPKPKPESLFPTFPSKAGQEKRHRHEPHAPVRGQQTPTMGEIDLSGIFQGREKEERGAGFTLRMV
ncbi:hypothetical protein S7711_06342 [Stachybotrys chartarum IBT 7711]|uniref:cyclin-dependent kinase n=1 Tax=Stachybotrys chartarum (strain CBS 109288 / IBT 7711) TaxID=1280523 RepID=A0A084AG67_STACB|nr:hypothetical protein S7711_06342 [Stachybotrys chartarum IBT 7711]